MNYIHLDSHCIDQIEIIARNLTRNEKYSINKICKSCVLCVFSDEGYQFSVVKQIQDNLFSVFLIDPEGTEKLTCEGDQILKTFVTLNPTIYVDVFEEIVHCYPEKEIFNE